eukprot:1299484-Prymnesium_polylepis.2
MGRCYGAGMISTRSLSDTHPPCQAASVVVSITNRAPGRMASQGPSSRHPARPKAGESLTRCHGLTSSTARITRSSRPSSNIRCSAA